MRRVVIHGVHRSGTSLIGSFLEKTGFWYGDDSIKMPAGPDNPQGFWERTDVVDLNDRILNEQSLNWFTLNPGFCQDEIQRLSELYKKDILLIDERVSSHSNIFIKDPRLSLLWPVWNTHLAMTHHIVVHRHPMEVAHSLHTRNGIPIDQGLLFWFHQTRAISWGLKNEKNVVNILFKNSDDWGHKAFEEINSIVENVDGLSPINQQDYEQIFDSRLVNNEYTDSEITGHWPQINEAWSLVQQSDLGSVSKLEFVQVQDLSWHDLDSRMASSIGKEDARRDLANVSTGLSQARSDFEQARLELDVYLGKYEAKCLEVEAMCTRFQSLNNDFQSVSEKYQTLTASHQELISDHQSQRDELDNRNERLLDIAVELRGLALTKRHLVYKLYSKALSACGFPQKYSINHAFNMAQFNYPSEVLDRILPKPSSRLLLLSAIAKNPMSFLKRLTLSRIIKGLKMVLGFQIKDLGVEQALLQYETYNTSENGLTINDPAEVELEKLSLQFEEVQSPRVSIVIPAYNNFATTVACLASIAAETPPDQISYEVLIADDCSTDSTSSIEAQIPGVKAIRPETNQGFLKNCNNAIGQAKGEFIALLNNDTNVQAGWLKELIDPLVHDESIGVTGPMFLYPDGRLQEAGGVIFTDGSGWNYGRYDEPSKPEYNYARDVDYVSGACLVFSKKHWEKVGGFDDLFAPAYYEDTDFCFQTRALSLRVRYIPTSKVVHFEGVSHGNNEDSGVKKYQAINRDSFALKWKDVLSKAHHEGPLTLSKARIHGKERKTLLFIDHYVPFYDKDAGSKVAQRYIELFIELGHHVIFLGDNFYPHQPYTKELQAKGVEVLYGEYYKNNWLEWLESNVDFIDSIYLNRPHITENYIDKIRSLSKIPFLAYHGADLHFVRVGREEELGVNTEGRTAAQWKELEFSIMQKCDISLWLSEFEINQIKSFDKNVVAAYKPMYWFNKDDLMGSREVTKDKNLLFVGGFGHPPNRDGLEWFLENVFPEICTEHPDVLLTIIGSNCPDEIRQLESENIRVLGFVSEEQLVRSYSEARVSVVPLRYGAGVKGKVIESLKYGVPVITTSVGAEGLPGKVDSYLSVEDDADSYKRNLLKLLQEDTACNDLINKADSTLTEYFSKDRALYAANLILGVREYGS